MYKGICVDNNQVVAVKVVKLDVQYIENWSLWLDIKILFKTVALVFKGDDGAQ